eukprot:29243_1
MSDRKRKAAHDNEGAPNTNTTSSNSNEVKKPPKKKRKKGKSNFWLVKIPNWLHDEWFDDTKYPNCSRLGELYVIPDQKDSSKKTMKLEVTRPHPQNPSKSSLHDRNHHRNNPLKQFENIPIPTHFKMEQREARHRVNVMHGELKVTGQDKLLVFHDKPPFPVGSHVEALDNSRNTNSHMMRDQDEDDDIKMSSKKKKAKNLSMSAMKGYAKGEVKEINDDRSFTVQFSKTKKVRYKVPERDIRFENPQEAQRANKCKIWGMVNGEMDVTPQWTPQYSKFLQLRSMKKAFQHTMQIKERKNIFAQSKDERERDAMKKISANKTTDRKHVKSNKNKTNVEKKKRVKNVRKEEKVYENLIFAAFEKDSMLNQKDIELKTSEPWNFLRPIVQKLCNRHQNAAKSGRSWVLKPEFRLATDTAIELETSEGD